jgi:hypothetical protein
MTTYERLIEVSTSGNGWIEGTRPTDMHEGVFGARPGSTYGTSSRKPGQW